MCRTIKNNFIINKNLIMINIVHIDQKQFYHLENVDIYFDSFA